MRTDFSGSQSRSMDESGNDLAISRAEWYRHAMTGTLIANPDSNRSYFEGSSSSYNPNDPCWYGQTPAPTDLLRQANSPISNMDGISFKECLINSFPTHPPKSLHWLAPIRYAQALLQERSPFPNPPAKRRLSLGPTSDLRERNGSHASHNNRDTNPPRHAENSSWNVIITTIPWLSRPSGARQHPPHQNEAGTLTKRLIANRSNYTQHVIHAPRLSNGVIAWIQVSPEACARDASTQLGNFTACTLTPSHLRSRDATLAGRQEGRASRRNPAQIVLEQTPYLAFTEAVTAVAD